SLQSCQLEHGAAVLRVPTNRASRVYPRATVSHTIAAALARGDALRDGDAGTSHGSKLVRPKIGKVLLHQRLHGAVRGVAGLTLHPLALGGRDARRLLVSHDCLFVGPATPEPLEELVEQRLLVRVP